MSIKGIMKFQSDRGLHKKDYDWNLEATNIAEELLEAIGIDDRNVAVLSIGDMQLRADEKIKQGLCVAPDTHEQVDAFGDVCVFAIGAIMKLGYDPELVIEEISKEINSREGSMIEGKFTKDKSPEAKAKWYKANFDNCKLYISEVTPPQREAYRNAHGHMADDETIATWIKTLIG